MILSPFLRRVLLLDAASCLGMGLLLAGAASSLAPTFGIDPTIVRGAGVALLPAGLFMLWLGTREAAHAGFVYLVIAGNALWALESLVLAGTTETITQLGTAFVSFQAAAVAGLALLEWTGLRLSRNARA